MSAAVIYVVLSLDGVNCLANMASGGGFLGNKSHIFPYCTVNKKENDEGSPTFLEELNGLRTEQ